MIAKLSTLSLCCFFLHALSVQQDNSLSDYLIMRMDSLSYTAFLLAD